MVLSWLAYGRFRENLRRFHDKGSRWFMQYYASSIQFLFLAFENIGLRLKTPAAPEHNRPAPCPMRISSAREKCPHCGANLVEPVYRPGRPQRGIVQCQIIAEPSVLEAIHVSRFCSTCAAGADIRY